MTTSTKITCTTYTGRPLIVLIEDTGDALVTLPSGAEVAIPAYQVRGGGDKLTPQQVTQLRGTGIRVGDDARSIGAKIVVTADVTAQIGAAAQAAWASSPAGVMSRHNILVARVEAAMDAVHRAEIEDCAHAGVAKARADLKAARADLASHEAAHAAVIADALAAKRAAKDEAADRLRRAGN
jgi:hypothetical protein